MLDTEKAGEKPDDMWLDLSDEDSCNWMMFVRPAQNHLEQNLVAYQYGAEIFYTTIKNIQPKQELKVCLSCIQFAHLSCMLPVQRQTADEEVQITLLKSRTSSNLRSDIFLRSWWKQSRVYWISK